MLHTTRLAIALSVALGLTAITWASSPPANSKAKPALDQTLPLVDLRNVTLADSLTFLRDVTGQAIHVNWKALEAAGVSRDTMVNLKLHKPTLRQALKLLLIEAAGTTDLTFYREDGTIEITTRDLADRQMLIVVYSVQDLLAEPLETVAFPDFTGGNNSSNNSYNSSNNGRNSSGTSRYTSRGGNDRNSSLGAGLPTPNVTGRAPDQQPKSQQLLELIVATVYPDMWTQNGGKASIRLFDGNLVVNAPRSVHETLGGPVD